MPLIINADDFGYSENRDAGIIHAFECGAISAASLIVNGPTAEKASKKAKEVGLYLGLHLNLTEGCSLSGPSKITKDNNELLYKYSFWNLIENGLQECLDSICDEVRAQMERFRTLTGKFPSHVDGHQHVHIFPGMAEILAPIFREYGVLSVRIPDEDVSNYEWLEPSRRKRYENRFPICMRSRLIYRKYNIRAPECFIGLGLMGTDMQANRFFNALEDVFGTVEWMVHPGYIGVKRVGPFNDDFDISLGREHELNELKKIEHKINLADWSVYSTGQLVQ